MQKLVIAIKEIWAQVTETMKEVGRFLRGLFKKGKPSKLSRKRKKEKQRIAERAARHEKRKAAGFPPLPEHPRCRHTIAPYKKIRAQPAKAEHVAAALGKDQKAEAAYAKEIRDWQTNDQLESFEMQELDRMCKEAAAYMAAGIDDLAAEAMEKRAASYAENKAAIDRQVKEWGITPLHAGKPVKGIVIHGERPPTLDKPTKIDLGTALQRSVVAGDEIRSNGHLAQDMIALLRTVKPGDHVVIEELPDTYMDVRYTDPVSQLVEIHKNMAQDFAQKAQGLEDELHRMRSVLRITKHSQKRKQLEKRIKWLEEGLSSLNVQNKNNI